MFFTVKLTDSYKILMVALRLKTRDENGFDTAGYHGYYICFHISVRIRIRIWIVSTKPDMIRLDIDIINMRFEYSDTDTVTPKIFHSFKLSKFDLIMLLSVHSIIGN